MTCPSSSADNASIRPRYVIPDCHDDIKGLKIAWSMELGFFEVDEHVRANTRRTLELLESLGAELVEVDFGWSDQADRAAQDYLDQCTAQSEPATTAGLVLWLRALNEAEEDTQASGGDEDAIQLVTHHSAKGLEWPIVIAMDLHAELKPRLWGLSILPSHSEVSLDNPLANRTLRYWPKFFGNHSANIELLDTIAD